jgi:hypothetical protein
LAGGLESLSFRLGHKPSVTPEPFDFAQAKLGPKGRRSRAFRLPENPEYPEVVSPDVVYAADVSHARQPEIGLFSDQRGKEGCGDECRDVKHTNVAQNRLWCTAFGFALQQEKLPKPAW